MWTTLGATGGLATMLGAAADTAVGGGTDFTGIALVLGAIGTIISALAGLVIALKKKPDGITPDQLREILNSRDEP